MIEVTGLSKRYGDVTAVHGMTFACAPGTVTGFLGPNGAGKSTTMRMICGMTPPTSGTATVAGTEYRRIANPARHVGVLLDPAAQHGGRTGRETLALTARLIGVPPRRADAMLDMVGLAGKPARRPVRAYSLGMRQRLGIAQALLGDPSVLILDEPANGLDPEGIRWMRTLLRGFADKGGTVLLSSHLLREVEAVADRFVVVARGRVVAQGTAADLLAGRAGTLVRGLDPAALAAALAAAGLPAAPDPSGAFTVAADAARVGRAAAAAGAVLVELRPAGDGLEDLFLSLTADREPVA
ncbi:Daunorubicin/doxorubicin resistance ATP-binding protein DrrA [Actinomadura rubteroloni]|uniref:Daunorubicin/doxorubicin resistance ATP-binding protein DrrA n=1 Tax=Actinomadura rubteroloni TaxID=1926885 RepID=A0A2P4UBA8_9ACTN|nr:ATP-binding cassette domain-containing protein [Actinomadura rubteroloni]POM22329.1 Daunorubicin/doxorubicin resistance ATP-binding protein DrrA [Actinomadura rubteroloni]